MKVERLTAPWPSSTATVMGVPPLVVLICTSALAPDVPRLR